jgi:hypothetical protein
MIRKGLRSVLFILTVALMAAIPATLIRSAEEKPDTQLTTDQAPISLGSQSATGGQIMMTAMTIISKIM